MPLEAESSVLFNLAEVMRLEQERVEAEQAAAVRAAERAAEARAAAAREAQRAVEQAREQELRQRSAREQEVARQQTAHQERLLRTRLELSMRERAAEREASRLHEQALRDLDVGAQARGRVRVLSALLSASLLGAAGLYAGVIAPALADAREREDQARRELRAQTTDLRQLRERIERVQQIQRAAATPLATSAGTTPAADAPARAPITRNRTTAAVVHSPAGSARRPPPTGARPGRASATRASQALRMDPLADIDVESRDPLIGVADPIR